MEDGTELYALGEPVMESRDNNFQPNKIPKKVPKSIEEDTQMDPKLTANTDCIKATKNVSYIIRAILAVLAQALGTKSIP